jgi:hypothetical protein
MRSLWRDSKISWQSDHELGSLTQIALDVDVSSMSANYLSGDSQTKTGASFSCRWVSLVEALKYMSHLLSWYTWSSIGYGNFDEVEVGLPGDYAYLAPGRGVFQGIVEQVVEDLFQAVDIADYKR